MPGEYGESLDWDAFIIRIPELMEYEPFVEDGQPRVWIWLCSNWGSSMLVRF